MNLSQKAYLAGFIDGEGSVGIQSKRGVYLSEKQKKRQVALYEISKNLNKRGR